MPKSHASPAIVRREDVTSASLQQLASGRLACYGLRVDGLVHPDCIGNRTPEFSWRLTGASGSRQDGYELEVFSGLDVEPVWQAVARGTETQAGIKYAGTPLASGKAYRWHVRAYDSSGAAGPWSDWQEFETGLFQSSDWTARWIGSSLDSPGRPIYLCGEVEVPPGSVRARVYSSALGWYRLSINGEDFTGSSLVPRFTSFDHEVEYQSYDVDSLLPARSLDIAMVIGDGRFRGALGMRSHRNTYGDKLSGLVQVVFDLDDGSRASAGTDASWRTGLGPILSSDPKFGETVDLRIPRPLTSRDSYGTRAVLSPLHARELVAETTPRLTAVDELAAAVSTRADGSHLVDFGQNFAGVVRMRVSGNPGDRIVLQHSEDIRPDGTLEWEHLDREGAKDKTNPQRFQRDEVILDGNEHWFQPSFTIHGFRYVEVTGVKNLKSGDIRGIVLSSDPAPTGSFDCSDPRLNQLWSNAYWSLRSNFLDTPTDCPTRERGGFTGDAMVFTPTATTYSDVHTYFRRYLQSLRQDQFDDGRVPMIIPGEFSEFSGGPTKLDLQQSNPVGWGDASVLIPWELYQRYGDTAVLEKQYESMKRWVGHLDRRGARKGFIWGEWIRPDESTARGVIRDNTINRKNIGLAYYAHSARMLSRIAKVLGKENDSVTYGLMADKAVKAWRRAALKRQSRVGVNRQDDYVRALAFDLLPEHDRPKALARLVALIEDAGDHLGTGFLSTPLLLPILTRYGRADVAYRLLLQTTAPSWLGMVEQGATTITEHWSEPGNDGNRKGSSNHYAFGSVVEWFISGILGLIPTGPGYRTVRIAPAPGGGLTHASGTVDTPFGPITTGWELTGGTGTLSVELPVGITAEIQRLDGTNLTLSAGSHRLSL